MSSLPPSLSSSRHRGPSVPIPPSINIRNSPTIRLSGLRGAASTKPPQLVPPLPEIAVSRNFVPPPQPSSSTSEHQSISGSTSEKSNESTRNVSAPHSNGDFRSSRSISNSRPVSSAERTVSKPTEANSSSGNSMYRPVLAPPTPITVNGQIVQASTILASRPNSPIGNRSIQGDDEEIRAPQANVPVQPTVAPQTASIPMTPAIQARIDTSITPPRVISQNQPRRDSTAPQSKPTPVVTSNVPNLGSPSRHVLPSPQLQPGGISRREAVPSINTPGRSAPATRVPSNVSSPVRIVAMQAASGASPARAISPVRRMPPPGHRLGGPIHAESPALTHPNNQANPPINSVSLHRTSPSDNDRHRAQHPLGNYITQASRDPIGIISSRDVSSHPPPLPIGVQESPPRLPVAGYQTPGRIQQRVEIGHAPRRQSPIAPPLLASPPPLAMPPVAPSIPMMHVHPIGTISSDPPPRGPYDNPSQTSQQAYGPAAMPVRPTRPNYSIMSESQRLEMRQQFRTKFNILRSSFPTWNIVDPPEISTLDQVHDAYEGYVRQIIVSLNCNQWKVYLIIMFLAIEVFGIKVLGLDFRGFTMSQARIMHRYDQVLVELGEKYYAQGPSNWPVEARIMMMAGFNAVIFIAVKYLSKWLGGDDMSGTIQGVVDQFLNGSTVFSGAPQQQDQFGIRVPPGTSAQPSAPAGAAPGNADASSNPLGGLGGILNSFLGGGAGGGAAPDMTSILANLGNAFTSNMAPSQAGPVASSSSTEPRNPGCGVPPASKPAPQPPRRQPVW